MMLVTTNLDMLASKINELLGKKNFIVIAIDGMCGSGKSYLANKLALEFNANLINVDDFYLPKNLRTKERFDEPGGNIDYVRFKNEVIDHLNDGDFSYHKYNCRSDAFYEVVNVNRKPIYIIEGSYSLHPYFKKYYDFSIFVSSSKIVQYNRLLMREGVENIDNFVNLWIPLENKYFDFYKISDHVDVIYTTTNSYN